MFICLWTGEGHVECVASLEFLSLPLLPLSLSLPPSLPPSLPLLPLLSLLPLPLSLPLSLSLARLDQESHIGKSNHKFEPYVYILSCVFFAYFLHSIMGEGEDVGVVPQFCQELFNRITGSATEQVYSGTL